MVLQNSSIFFTSKVIILTIVLSGCNARIELLQGISESEANEALAVLLDSGVKAGKLPGKDGLVGLEVESAHVAKAIDILRAEGLPKERYAKMGEVFRKEGLISSPLEERARYLWALSQELSATVSQIDGVIKARVHVVLPERSSAGDPAMPSSAAVFIKHKAGISLDDTVPQVKRLISNSIPGLTADKVTVILLPAGIKTNDENTKSTALVTQNTQGLMNESGDKDDLRKNGSKNTKTRMLITLVTAFLALTGLIYVGWKKWGNMLKANFRNENNQKKPNNL